MDIKTMKMIQQNIADVLGTYGFTGDIKVNEIYEDTIDNNYISLYYFNYEDEIYHIVAVYSYGRLVISLNNEIARKIVK